jgi:hypothetical protein
VAKFYKSSISLCAFLRMRGRVRNTNFPLIFPSREIKELLRFFFD